MKKILLFAVAVTATGTLFTSCKKEQSCECSYNIGGTALSKTYELGKVSKKEAKDACNEHQTQVASMGANASCSVK